MKVVEEANATATLAEYTAEIDKGPVIVTNGGQPVAVLMPLENVDLETATLSANREFVDLIERSRARAKAEGTISSAEMRRRFE